MEDMKPIMWEELFSTSLKTMFPNYRIYCIIYKVQHCNLPLLFMKIYKDKWYRRNNI